MRYLGLSAILLIGIPLVAGQASYAELGPENERQFTVWGDFSVAVNATHVQIVTAPEYTLEDEQWTYTNVSAVSAAIQLDNGTTLDKRSVERDAQLEPQESVSASFRLPVDVRWERLDSIQFGINHTAVSPTSGRYFSVTGTDTIERYIPEPDITLETNTSTVNRDDPLWINGTANADTVYIEGTPLSVINGTFTGWVDTDDLARGPDPQITIHTSDGAIVEKTIPVTIEAQKPDVTLEVPNTIPKGEKVTIDVQVDKEVSSLTVNWLDWELEASSDGSFIIPTENSSISSYGIEIEITDTDGVTVVETANFDIIDPDRYQSENNEGDEDSKDDGNGETDDPDENGDSEDNGLPLVRGFRTFVEDLITGLLGLN